MKDCCNRCHNSPVDLTHMFWSCPKLTNHWDTIFKVLSEALNLNIYPMPACVSFGFRGRSHFNINE